MLPPLIPFLALGSPLGSLLGSWLIHRLSQRTFDLIAVSMSAVAAAALLVPAI